MATTLLEYVIAYCQEEMGRHGKKAPPDEPVYRKFDPDAVEHVLGIVDDAIDAYEGGAR